MEQSLDQFTGHQCN